MARDNDKGLYLPLKIDLDAWEQQLMTADADLKKAMREMSSAARDLKLQYEVQISGAEASGNKLKALELESRKLNQLFDIQKRKVDALNKAYEKSVADTGKMSKASQDLARTLARETIEMNKLQKQLNAIGEGLGAKISDKLAELSPTFRTARAAVSELTSTLGTVSVASKTAAVALGGIGIALGAVYASYKGLDAITNGINNIAEAGKNAADPVYQLRERLQSTYEDAEYLQRVTALDGSNADALASTLERLKRALDKDKEGTSQAAQALKRYGIELRNADGSMKSYREMLKAISQGYQVAVANGENLNFFAAFKGMDQFSHLLAGLEGYNALAVAASSNTKKLYDELHDYGNWLNVVAEAERELAVIRGGFFAGAGIENLKNEADALKATAIILDENRKLYGEMSKRLGDLSNEFTNFESVATIALEKVKLDAIGLLNTLSEIPDEMKWAMKFAVKTNPILGPVDSLLDLLGVKEYLSGVWDESKAELSVEKEKVKQEREKAEKEAKERIRQLEERAKNAKLAEPVDTASIKKRAEAEARVQKEIRDLQSSDYERAINRIKEQYQANLDAGVALVDADRLFSLQKEQIDKQYFEKYNSMLKKQTSDATAAYDKQAEAAKKANEAAMSDAESTLKNNIKILRRLVKEQQAGGDFIGRTKDYANKLYMKSNGFKASDIEALQRFGVDLIKEIGNARDRIFAGFTKPQQDVVSNARDRLASDYGEKPATPAQETVNNNTTINIDRPVLTDENLVSQLADKVADKILPIFKQQELGYKTT